MEVHMVFFFPPHPNGQKKELQPTEKELQPPQAAGLWLKMKKGGNNKKWVFPKIVGKPQKWMVKIMENPIKMDDLGGKPTIFGNIQIGIRYRL